MIECYLALGSNLDTPREQICRAMAAFDTMLDCQLLAQSSLYVTAPMGPQAQDNFVNAAIKIATDLSPQQLLQRCMALETAHQRSHQYHWGPRTLDVDIILYGKASITEDNLTIPHPEMLKRDFVLIPILEIDSQLTLPSKKSIAAALNELKDKTVLKRLPSASITL